MPIIANSNTMRIDRIPLRIPPAVAIKIHLFKLWTYIMEMRGAILVMQIIPIFKEVQKGGASPN